MNKSALKGRAYSARRRGKVAAKSTKKKTSRAAKDGAAGAELAGRIVAAVRRIPRGRVSTYGAVADVAGLPRRARLVGTVLRTTSVRDLPWFRVINASGRISFPAGSDAYLRQRRKLEAEGIVFIGGRISLDDYGWPDRAQQLDELLWKPR
jgi:methylated-DNA-protein-cysteine methyltransferase-like protein